MQLVIRGLLQVSDDDSFLQVSDDLNHPPIYPLRQQVLLLLQQEELLLIQTLVDSILVLHLPIQGGILFIHLRALERAHFKSSLDQAQLIILL